MIDVAQSKGPRTKLRTWVARMTGGSAGRVNQRDDGAIDQVPFFIQGDRNDGLDVDECGVGEEVGEVVGELACAS